MLERYGPGISPEGDECGMYLEPSDGPYVKFSDYENKLLEIAKELRTITNKLDYENPVRDEILDTIMNLPD